MAFLTHGKILREIRAGYLEAFGLYNGYRNRHLCCERSAVRRGISRNVYCNIIAAAICHSAGIQLKRHLCGSARFHVAHKNIGAAAGNGDLLGQRKVDSHIFGPHGTAGSQHIDGQREIAARVDAAAAIAGGGDDQRRGLGALGGRTHALADGLRHRFELACIVIVRQIERKLIIPAQVSNVVQDNRILKTCCTDFIGSECRRRDISQRRGCERCCRCNFNIRSQCASVCQCQLISGGNTRVNNRNDNTAFLPFFNALELCSCSIRDCISRNVRVACNRSRRCVTAAGTRAGTCA